MAKYPTNMASVLDDFEDELDPEEAAMRRAKEQIMAEQRVEEYAALKDQIEKAANETGADHSLVRLAMDFDRMTRESAALSAHSRAQEILDRAHEINQTLERAGEAAQRLERERDFAQFLEREHETVQFLEREHAMNQFFEREREIAQSLDQSEHGARTLLEYGARTLTEILGIDRLGASAYGSLTDSFYEIGSSVGDAYRNLNELAQIATDGFHSTSESLERVRRALREADLIIGFEHRSPAVEDPVELSEANPVLRGSEEQEERDESEIQVFPAETLQRLREIQFLPITDVLAIRKDPRLMRELSPRKFEFLIAEVLNGLGYEDIVITDESGDGGIDVYATKKVNGIPLIFGFECKRYGEKNKIQLGVVRSLLGSVVQSNTSVAVGVLVTTSFFTKGAINFFAENANIQGRDFDGVVDWIRESSISKSA